MSTENNNEQEEIESKETEDAVPEESAVPEENDSEIIEEETETQPAENKEQTNYEDIETNNDPVGEEKKN